MIDRLVIDRLVIDRVTWVRLARKVRLRQDPISGKMMLLYPERGLELSDTAAEIASLCGRGGTVPAMVDALCARFADQPRERIETEVMTFLAALADRGLLVQAVAGGEAGDGGQIGDGDGAGDKKGGPP